MANASTVDPVALLQARAHVYDLLSAAFDGDVEVLAKAMEDDVFARLADTLPTELETDALTAETVDTEALAYGYDNLFEVPGPNFVPPFASAHRADPSEQFESDSPYHEEGAAGELLGDPAAEIAELYAQVDFQPERGEGIPDHLAAELEFMYALVAQEAHLRADDDDHAEEVAALRDLQRTTLTQLGWLDDFDQEVADRDTVEGVFAGLVRFTRVFCAWDARDGVEVAC